MVSKVILNQKDDIVEDLLTDNVGENVNILIEDTDLDYIMPEEEDDSEQGKGKGRSRKGNGKEYEMTTLE